MLVESRNFNITSKNRVKPSGFFIFAAIFLKNMKSKLILLLGLVIAYTSLAQNDTIISRDNNVLNGEIKDMDRGVLTLETSYSDSDFKIEWLEIKMIISDQKFQIILTDGERYYGSIKKDTIHNKIIINDPDKGYSTTEINKIVYLKQINEGNIFDVINLNLDLGYSFTKSNNLHQLNGNLNADYYRNKWGLAISTSTIQNYQDNAPNTDRFTGNIDFKYFLRNDYFLSAIGDYFSNNEQQLKLRSTYNLSIGHYFKRTNKVYFNASIGFALTRENYFTEIEDIESFEGSAKVEYNMFDVGDFNMFASFTAYPSLTEKGRFRATSNLTAKYDLPRDFYLKTTYDYNYDNKPAEGAFESDYVFTFGVGWEL